ncbi:membrane-spanning 4-domains subfamily A member 6D-like [Ochotona curzoniae]|uniref:membrane-spanning 4-domains subfamily A member 6D-like n=1 Tax=Ochotona curzoniae TaxID=130825 RepID=UPI001B34B162|nr:membrane-spanning 4-domains subfamily A member 6D-like [Ochotona curzoniae]
MISQPNARETIAVLTTRGINLPESEKPLHRGQDILKKYLKAEIKVTGTLQILGGVMVLSLGIILASAPISQHFSSVFSILLKSGYPFIGALFFILSGVLSILTEQRSTKHWVHSSLATSILSVLFALMGSIILSVNLLALSPASQQWSLVNDAHLHYAGVVPCSPYCCAMVETGSFQLCWGCAFLAGELQE